MPAACFPCSRAAAADPSPTAPSFSTSLYPTPLGPASLTWSRTFLGLSLSLLLPLPHSSAPSSPSSSASVCNPISLPTRFHIRPSLLWLRRGSRRFRLRHPDPPVVVDLSWDLFHAAFSAGGPEPMSGFLVSVAVDGEVVLVVGDKDGRKSAKWSLPRPALPVSKREHVVLADRGGGSRPYEYLTTVLAGGKQRRVTVEIGALADKDIRLLVSIDGRRILQVKRLRWKFRGNQRIDLDGGGGGGSTVLVSWDVHGYLFPTSSRLPATEANHAIILLCFEAEPIPCIWGRAAAWRSYSLLGIETVGGRKQTRLSKTRSASSASSVTSSGSGWSVAEWQSAEENELREAGGFTLLLTFARR